MLGIEPTSARNWGHHGPTLGTVIFHCHGRMSLLFKLLVPSGWLWSLAWGSGVGVHGIPYLWVPSFAQTLLPGWWVLLGDWAQRHMQQGAAWCLEAQQSGIRHYTWKSSFIKLCVASKPKQTLYGLGSKSPHNWRKLWAEWRPCAMGTEGSSPGTAVGEILSKSFQRSELVSSLIKWTWGWAAYLLYPQALVFNSVILTVFLDANLWVQRPKTKKISLLAP